MKGVIANQGITQEGLFRITAKPTEINPLRQQLELDQSYIYSDVNSHVPANLLKEWLRNLSDRIIPTRYYREIISHESDLKSLVSSLEKLPEINRKVLFKLLHFLQKVVAEKKNLMDARALAIVMSPNLFETPSDEDLAALSAAISLTSTLSSSPTNTQVPPVNLVLQLGLAQAEIKIVELMISELVFVPLPW